VNNFIQLIEEEEDGEVLPDLYKISEPTERNQPEDEEIEPPQYRSPIAGPSGINKKKPTGRLSLAYFNHQKYYKAESLPISSTHVESANYDYFNDISSDSDSELYARNLNVQIFHNRPGDDTPIFEDVDDLFTPDIMSNKKRKKTHNSQSPKAKRSLIDYYSDDDDNIFE